MGILVVLSFCWPSAEGELLLTVDSVTRQIRCALTPPDQHGQLSGFRLSILCSWEEFWGGVEREVQAGLGRAHFGDGERLVKGVVQPDGRGVFGAGGDAKVVQRLEPKRTRVGLGGEVGGEVGHCVPPRSLLAVMRCWIHVMNLSNTKICSKPRL